MLDDCPLQFVGVHDFLPEVTRSINLFEAEESVFHTNISLNGICRWNSEMVMWVKLCWMCGLEDSLRGVCCMSFKYPFVVMVHFLGSVGVMPDMQEYFNAIKAAAISPDGGVSHFPYLIYAHVRGLPYFSSFSSFPPVNLACSFVDVLGIFFEPCCPADGGFLPGCPQIFLCRAHLFPNCTFSYCCSFLEVCIVLCCKADNFLAWGYVPRFC